MSQGVPYLQSSIELGVGLNVRLALNDQGLILDGTNFWSHRLVLTYDPSFSNNLFVFRNLHCKQYSGLPDGGHIDLLNLENFNGQQSIGIHPKGLVVISSWPNSVPFSRFSIHGSPPDGYDGWNLKTNRFVITSAYPVFVVAWQGTFPGSGRNRLYFNREEGVDPARTLVVIWGS